MACQSAIGAPSLNEISVVFIRFYPDIPFNISPVVSFGLNIPVASLAWIQMVKWVTEIALNLPLTKFVINWFLVLNNTTGVSACPFQTVFFGWGTSASALYVRSIKIDTQAISGILLKIHAPIKSSRGILHEDMSECCDWELLRWKYTPPVCPIANIFLVNSLVFDLLIINVDACTCICEIKTVVKAADKHLIIAWFDESTETIGITFNHFTFINMINLTI